MIYNFFKFILSIGLNVFFRRILVHNKQFLRTDAPLLIVANHPNTFMDPMLIAHLLNQQVYFLANGGVFNKITKILFKQLNMVPIYRKTDASANVGVNMREQNNKAFSTCYEYLGKKRTILIFPEGSSIIERRLRELKTGTARIALGAEFENDFELNLQILPIGVNYSDATRFRSEVFINVGAPISLKDFKEKYNPETAEVAEITENNVNNAENTSKKSNSFKELTEKIGEKLLELMIVTDDEAEDKFIQNIEKIYKNRLFEDENISLDAKIKDFELTKHIVKATKYFEATNPKVLDNFKIKLDSYLGNLQKLKISDAVFSQSKKNKNILVSSLFSMLFMTVCFPFFVFGFLNNYLPYKLPSLISRKITDDETFFAPIMLASGIFTFISYYCVVLWAVQTFWLHNFLWLLGYFILMVLSGFFALFYTAFFENVKENWQFISIFYKKNTLISTLVAQRKEIFNFLENAKKEYLVSDK